MFVVLKNANKYSTWVLSTQTRTRLQHQVLVLDNFKSCVLVLEACVIDSTPAPALGM